MIKKTYHVTKTADCPYGIFLTSPEGDRFVAYNIGDEAEAFIMARALNERKN